MAIIKSRPGHEVSYIPAGPFKIRLPFLHYRFEWMDFLLGCVLCCTCLGAITLNQAANPHLPYEVVWSMVIINGLLYMLQVLLGDPVVPGWITPSIALTTVYLMQFPEGNTRVQALCAVQLLVAFLYLFMGITGLANKLVGIVPNCVKAGILIGAAISACWGELKDGGRFNIYPIAAIICTLLAMFFLYSKTFQHLRTKSKFFDFIGRFGMIPAILLCIVIAPLVGETAWPNFSAVSLGNLIKLPNISMVLKYCCPFVIGFPTGELFLKAIPQAIVIYIIGFGDFVTCKALMADAQSVRKDEKIFFSPNRSNLICGIRNLVLGLVCPYVNMAGPLGAPLAIAVLNRYKEGKKAMESVWSGMGSFRIGTAFAVAFVPIVSVLNPILPPAVCLCMFIQAYSMMQVAFDQTRDNIDICIMGTMGVFLASKGALVGLAAGLAMYFVIADKNKIRSDYRLSMEEAHREYAEEEAEKRLIEQLEAEEREERRHKHEHHHEEHHKEKETVPESEE